MRDDPSCGSRMPPLDRRAWTSPPRLLPRKKERAEPRRIGPRPATEALPAPLKRSNGYRLPRNLRAALELPLQVRVALGKLLGRLAAHEERHEQLAEPVALEVELEGEARAVALAERLESTRTSWRLRSISTLCTNGAISPPSSRNVRTIPHAS